MKRPPIIEAVWDDHSWSRFRPGAKLVRRRTVGYLVKDGPRVLKLASTTDPEGGLEEITTIGKAMLVRQRVLVPADDPEPDAPAIVPATATAWHRHGRHYTHQHVDDPPAHQHYVGDGPATDA